MEEEIESREINLMDLPNCVLLHLLSFLDSSSLFKLSCISERLHDLVTDESLWKFVELRDRPVTLEKIKFSQQMINKKTLDYRVCGTNPADRFPKIITCLKEKACHLTILALENQFIDGSETPLTMFPSALTELSLKGTYVMYASNFMKNCSSNLRDLKILILDDCPWATSHIMMNVSRLPNLEILSMYKCKRKSSADICYLSVAAICGFPKLKVLNARFIAFPLSTLNSFYKHSKLQELYLQCYERTYRLEKAQRDIEILTGNSKPEGYYYHSEEVDVDDTNPKTMKKAFGKCFFTKQSTDMVDDANTYSYVYTKSVPIDTPVFNGGLYRPQYGECKCGFFTKFWATNERQDLRNTDEELPKKIEKNYWISRLRRPPVYYFKYVNIETMELEVYAAVRWLKRKIIRDKYRIKNFTDRHIYTIKQEFSTITDLNVLATRKNKLTHFLHMRYPKNDYEISVWNHSNDDDSYWQIEDYLNTNADHNYHMNNVRVIEVDPLGDWHRRMYRNQRGEPDDDNIEVRIISNRPRFPETMTFSQAQRLTDARPGPSKSYSDSDISENANHGSSDGDSSRKKRDFSPSLPEKSKNDEGTHGDSSDDSDSFPKFDLPKGKNKAGPSKKLKTKNSDLSKKVSRVIEKQVTHDPNEPTCSRCDRNIAEVDKDKAALDDEGVAGPSRKSDNHYSKRKRESSSSSDDDTGSKRNKPKCRLKNKKNLEKRKEKSNKRLTRERSPDYYLTDSSVETPVEEDYFDYSAIPVYACEPGRISDEKLNELLDPTPFDLKRFRDDYESPDEDGQSSKKKEEAAKKANDALKKRAHSPVRKIGDKIRIGPTFEIPTESPRPGGTYRFSREPNRDLVDPNDARFRLVNPRVVIPFRPRFEPMHMWVRNFDQVRRPNLDILTYIRRAQLNIIINRNQPEDGQGNRQRNGFDIKKYPIMLKRLSLRGFSNITDATLTNLQDVDLELLDVTYTRVTKQGLLNYILSHPKTRVVHEYACTCGPRMDY